MQVQDAVIHLATKSGKAKIVERRKQICKKDFISLREKDEYIDPDICK